MEVTKLPPAALNYRWLSAVTDFVQFLEENQL